MKAYLFPRSDRLCGQRCASAFPKHSSFPVLVMAAGTHCSAPISTLERFIPPDKQKTRLEAGRCLKWPIRDHATNTSTDFILMSNLIVSCVIKKSYWYVWITLNTTIWMICPRCSVQDEAEPTSASWSFQSSLRSTKYLILAELEIIYGWSLYFKRPPHECMTSLRFTDTSTCVEWFDFPTSCKKLRKRQDDNNNQGNQVFHRWSCFHSAFF